MTTYGWLLVPVAVNSADTSPDALDALVEDGAFDFDNAGAYADVSANKQYAFVSTDDAPTFYDALKELKLA